MEDKNDGTRNVDEKKNKYALKFLDEKSQTVRPVG
jgi:hypothetical protein